MIIKKKVVPILTASLLGVVAHAGEISMQFEEPSADNLAAGVNSLRGWAFSDVDIDTVELLINDQLVGEIPYGAPRGDVQNAFPDAPNALYSGFGATVNFGLFDAGDYDFAIRVTDTDGDTRVVERSITVGNFAEEFVSADQDLNLDNANVTGSGSSINIEGLVIDDQAFDITLNWLNSQQSFGFQSIGAPYPASGGGGCADSAMTTTGTYIAWDVENYDNGVLSATAIVQTTYTDISDTQTVSDTYSEATDVATQEVAISDSETTQRHVRDGQWLDISEIETEATGTTMGISASVHTLIEFDPAKKIRLFGDLCVGDTWTVASVQSTFTTLGLPFPIPPVVSQTAEEMHEVTAVNEQVTVPAGTFNTIIVETTDSDGRYQKVWIDMDSSLPVRQEGDNGQGETDVTVATDVQLP